MADNDNGQEKTLPASEKRRRDFRERGQVPRSREVTSAFMLAVGGAVILKWVPHMGGAMQELFIQCYARVPDGEFNTTAAMDLFAVVARALVWMLAPILGSLFVCVTVVEGVMGRGAIPKEPLKFDLQKINVLTNAQKQYLSAQPLIEAVKGFLKLVVIAWLVWSALDDELHLIPALINATPAQILSTYGDLARILLNRAVPVAFVLATLDYLYQWHKNEEEMKMTRQEVKQEHKDSDGDPIIRQRRRQRMREILTNRSVLDVAKADVVITNPTHYAVALRYRKEEGPAPMVLAKGVDHLAMRIKAEAARHDVPQVENRALARALYAQSKVGQHIPEELYGAVARVLAVIWRRKARSRAGRH